MSQEVAAAPQLAEQVLSEAKPMRLALPEAILPVKRLAMNEITTYRWSFPEDVIGYRDAGISGIGVWRPKLEEFGTERGIDLLDDAGLKVTSLSYVGGFTGSCGQTFEESVDDAVAMVQLASRIQAESLVVVSGARALHTARHARRVFVDGLRMLGDLAGERGITLSVLPMHSMFARQWTFLTTIDETLELLDLCDHPQLKMVFDAYHLWQEPRLFERIPQIAPRTSLVRLSDWRDPPRSDHDRCLPGDGCIPLSPILQHFHRAGYRGSFEIEIWSEELWAADYIELVEECRSRFESLCAGHSIERTRATAAVQ